MQTVRVPDRRQVGIGDAPGYHSRAVGAGVAEERLDHTGCERPQQIRV